MVALVVVMAILIVLPIAMFFGLIGLTLLIWCWRRIGPYFVNFGRWTADWRNLVPCSCTGCGCLIFLLVVAPLFLPHSLGILRILGLIVLILVIVVFGTFAMIALTVRLLSGGWPRFRRWFWRFPPMLWDLVYKKIPEQFEKRMPGGPQAGKKTTARKPAPTQPSGTAGIEAKPTARAGPPARRSWLDISWLWSLLWGKPQQPVKKKPRANVVSPEMQSQVAVSPTEKAKVRVSAKPPQTGLRPLTWRLGLFVSWLKRRMQWIWGKPAPAGKKPMGAQSKPNAASATPTGQSTSAAVAPGIKTQNGKRKPSKGASSGPVAAVNFVRKRFWLSVFWVVERVRTGVDLILRLLHLNGRKK